MDLEGWKRMDMGKRVDMEKREELKKRGEMGERTDKGQIEENMGKMQNARGAGGMGSTENMVELRHVVKAYKKNVLFTDLNLAIPKGDICGIVGPNGTGKSVLFKMICGLAQPDRGEILIDGEALKKGMFPRNAGVILDSSGFLPDETGLKNLEILAGIRGKVKREKLADLLWQVGLDPELKVKVAKYSLGMKQRLAMAQALMEDPSLLILDEPFESVDDKGVEHLRNMLKSMNEEQAVTILLTSHNSQDILTLCRSIYRLQGKDLQRAEEVDLVWDCEM